jgi:hypothetical protein
MTIGGDDILMPVAHLLFACQAIYEGSSNEPSDARYFITTTLHARQAPALPNDVHLAVMGVNPFTLFE